MAKLDLQGIKDVKEIIYILILRHSIKKKPAPAWKASTRAS